MKNLIKTITVTLVAVLLINTVSEAGNKDKFIEKATQAVQNGAPDDWKLLATQADYLISRNAGLSSAKEWIMSSLEIKEDSYNLEIMGDYYMACNLPKEAIVYYIKSIDSIKEEDANKDTSYIQDKIVAARG